MTRDPAVPVSPQPGRHTVNGGPGPRIGFFGILAAGNLGNDGSLDAAVTLLRNRHPDAELTFMGVGTAALSAHYGAPAIPLQWNHAHGGSATGWRGGVLKVLGKVLDPFRTFAWVRGLDVVIVPGMGVLEASVRLRAWAFPYSLFMLCLSARLSGTRCALICVGAEPINGPIIRWLTRGSARLASYRSFRDSYSRDAISGMGIDTSSDEIYTDLAFALPTPPAGESRTGVVGIGVMAYHGRNEDGARATEIHVNYVSAVNGLVRWLVDRGTKVRLFTGDPGDEPVVANIIDDLRAHRPGLEPDCVVAEPAADLSSLMYKMTEVDAVVATRYHNVLSALKTATPTISIGYATKHDVLMDSMGLGEFAESARSIDPDRLVARFVELESRSGELRRTLQERNRLNSDLLERQFDALSTALLASGDSAPSATGFRGAAR